MSEQHYIYKIVRDEDPESPRDWDNIGTMCCWHRRYNLGDVQPQVEAQDYVAELIGWDDEKQEAVYQFWYNKLAAEERHRKAEADREQRERTDLVGFPKVVAIAEAQAACRISARNLYIEAQHDAKLRMAFSAKLDEEWVAALERLKADVQDDSAKVEAVTWLFSLPEGPAHTQERAMMVRQSYLEEKAAGKLQERLQEEFDRQYISLPLYLYDHSGISISTGSFSCPWDSGQLGLIYVSKDKIRQDYGIKHVTKAWADKIRGYLKDEVETYDQFLTGDVWGFQVFEVPEGVDPEEEIDELEEVESCFGFFGEDCAEQEAKESVAYFEEHHAELMFKRRQAEYREAGQMELALAA